MADIQFSNNAKSTLASSIAAGDLSLSVQPGEGALFPTLTGTQYFYCTLVNPSNQKEIIKVTARSTDTFTIVRAQEGTSALSFSTGDKVELRVTAGGLSALRTEPVSDANAIVHGSSDATKKLRFEVDGFTTGQTRVVTFPDGNLTIPAVIGDFKADGTVPMSGNLVLDATYGVVFEGTTADAFETTLVAGEPTTDRIVALPDATTTLAGLGVTETFTAPQRGTVTTDNDLSFDLNVTNFFVCTPTAGGALTFTNIPTGQGGTIKLVNGSNYAITAAANTKVTSTFLATISATGTYIINYFADGTNVHCSCAGASA